MSYNDFFFFFKAMPSKLLPSRGDKWLSPVAAMTHCKNITTENGTRDALCCHHREMGRFILKCLGWPFSLPCRWRGLECLIIIDMGRSSMVGSRFRDGSRIHMAMVSV